jgi:hypothetical protein
VLPVSVCLWIPPPPPRPSILSAWIYRYEASYVYHNWAHLSGMLYKSLCFRTCAHLPLLGNGSVKILLRQRTCNSRRIGGCIVLSADHVVSNESSYYNVRQHRLIYSCYYPEWKVCCVLECVFQDKLFMILHTSLALIFTEIQTDCYKATLQALHYTRVKSCLLFIALIIFNVKSKACGRY